jgi:hypothetical protein
MIPSLPRARKCQDDVAGYLIKDMAGYNRYYIEASGATTEYSDAEATICMAKLRLSNSSAQASLEPTTEPALRLLRLLRNSLVELVRGLVHLCARFLSCLLEPFACIPGVSLGLLFRPPRVCLCLLGLQLSVSNHNGIKDSR